jgi:hypothetical protein
LAASYNAGPNKVKERGFSPRHLSSGTQSYVERVKALHDFYLDRRREGMPAYASAGEVDDVRRM